MSILTRASATYQGHHFYGTRFIRISKLRSVLLSVVTLVDWNAFWNCKDKPPEEHPKIERTLLDQFSHILGDRVTAITTGWILSIKILTAVNKEGHLQVLLSLIFWGSVSESALFLTLMELWRYNYL
jgi:hypothetical protein